ncbi:MAG: ComF family protein [Polyangiaceae bacterium]|nr:ComF family protein [Polyangiaceae bacterium]
MPSSHLVSALARAVTAAVLDALSPPACAACDLPISSRHVFCPACAATLVRDSPHPDGSIAFGCFGGAIAKALTRFKYEGRADLARPLGQLLRRAVMDADIRADVVVPVPLHPRRLAERGYNQSALLARAVAEQLEVPFAPRALERRRETAQQARLGRAQRLANMAEAFDVRDVSAVQSRHVLLVDDVLTTGATLLACRQALIAAGAVNVTSVCLARAGKG